MRSAMSVVPFGAATTASAQRGRDLVDAHASGCHFFDGLGFQCGQGHNARKLLVNTWYLRNMWLWCKDVMSLLCVGVSV